MTYDEAMQAVQKGLLILRVEWRQGRQWSYQFLCQKKKQHPNVAPTELLWLATDDLAGWHFNAWVPREEDIEAADWEVACDEDQEHWNNALAFWHKEERE
jgi:hypothetical protein